MNVSKKKMSKGGTSFAASLASSISETVRQQNKALDDALCEAHRMREMLFDLKDDRADASEITCCHIKECPSMFFFVGEGKDINCCNFCGASYCDTHWKQAIASDMIRRCPTCTWMRCSHCKCDCMY